MISILNKNIYLYTLILFYFFSILYLKEVIFLFYNTVESPDFIKYFKYIEFNFGVVSETGSEQGFLYYDLISHYFNLRNFNISNHNFFVYISKSIQEVNLILFLIGSLGIFKLLKIFQYDKIQIMTTLIVLNFLPISIAQRMIFKPEILAFALLPWVILLFEKFLLSNEIRYLFICIPFLVSMLSQKGSIFIMISVFILLFYFLKILNKLITFRKKELLLILILFFSTLFAVINENNSLNTIKLFDLQSGSSVEEKYNNKGNLSLLYKIDPEKLFFYPYKNLHNESAIHITLLDSFGDYFDIYWDNDSSNFYKLRKNIIIYETSDELQIPSFSFKNKELKIFVQDKNPNYYTRKVSSLLVAIFFHYFFIVLCLRAEKRKKKFYVLPFLGYFLLLVHIITGYPSNNFDPLIADTLKPIYYSFFILIACSFVTAEITKNKIRSFILLLIFLPTFLFILGLPRNQELPDNINLPIVNSYSDFCTFNNVIFNLNMYSKCGPDEKHKINLISYEEYEKFILKPKNHKANSFLILLDFFGLIYLTNSFSRSTLLSRFSNIKFIRNKDKSYK